MTIDAAIRNKNHLTGIECREVVFVCDLLHSDVWLLLILAAAIAAVLACSQTAEKTERLAAFFTVLGDGLILLSLWKGQDCPKDSDIL